MMDDELMDDEVGKINLARIVHEKTGDYKTAKVCNDALYDRFFSAYMLEKDPEGKRAIARVLGQIACKSFSYSELIKTQEQSQGGQ